MIVTEIVVLAVVAAGLIGFHTLRVKRKLRLLADQIRVLRGAALDHVHYRPMKPDETWLDASRDLYEAITRELGQNGAGVLGDLVEEDGAGKARGMARWLADSDGTTCGWFAALPSERGIQKAMLLFSEAPSSEFFVTHLGPTSVHLATPPFVHRRDHPSTAGIGATLAEHLNAVSPVSGLRRIDDLDGAVALVRRLRKATADWRASQGADELLVQDLRAILQDRFDKLSPALLRLLK